jgi:hypothetical protein
MMEKSKMWKFANRRAQPVRHVCRSTDSLDEGHVDFGDAAIGARRRSVP